ncbi:MAG: hypothetical protein ABIM88_07970 [candidate division WOR-3 bacterium]
MQVLLLALVITPGHGDAEIARLILSGELPPGFYWTMPFVLPDTVIGEGSLWEELRCASPRFSAAAGYESDTFQRLSGTASLSHEDGALFASAEPFIWIGNDSLYPARWKGIRSDWMRAFVGFQNGNLSGYWGRAPVSWGPPLANRLMFDGGNFPPFDCGEIAWRCSFMRISLFFGVLDPYPIEDVIDTSENLQHRTEYQRFINGHRVEFLILGRLNMAWSETVRYAREEGGPSLQYFNPFPIYYAYSWTGSFQHEDDYAWDLDATLSLPGLLLYGEFYIDDFQYVPDTIWDPNQIALAFGAMKSAGPLILRMDYSAATRWTFNSRLRTTKAIYRAWPYGHPLGSDFQRFLAELEWQARPVTRITLGLSFTQDGAGSVHEKMPYYLGFPKENFLTPPVQTEARGWVGASWIRGLASFDLRLGYRDISRWKHVEGESLSGFFFAGGIGASIR